MKLIQKLDKPISGYWDGGSKSVFEWEIQGNTKRDSKGEFVEIGSWEANHWFHVAKGKTEKQTLANAKRHLKAIMLKQGDKFGNVSFEYAL